MKVTDIASPASKPGSYRISVDDKPVGYISAEDMFELGIVLNNEIGKDAYEQLLFKVKYHASYSDALRYVDRRLRTKAEVKHYLNSQGCDPDIGADIISRLQKLGLIDEKKVVQAYVHDASLGQPKSRRELELKLRQKQIDPSLIKEELKRVDYDDGQVIDQLIAKKSKLSAYANNQPKLFRYLLSKGFSYDDIAARIGRPKVN